MPLPQAIMGEDMSYDGPIGFGRTAHNRELIDSTVEGARKSAFVAYLLLSFLGPLGTHNFYLGRPGLGFLQLAGTVFTWCAYVSDEPWPLIGIAAGIALGINLLVDMFLIPARVLACSERLRARLEDDTEWSGA